MVTIVFAHPWHGSFNKAILDSVTVQLEADKRQFTVIDLNKDNFNPVMTEADLKLFSEGGTTDSMVEKYKSILAKTNEIVFIFPIWWHTAPAILKGFFDKVLLVNFAYNYEGGWTPMLNIQKSTVITTSDGPTERFVSSIEGEFIPDMLYSVGIKNATWYNMEETSHGKTDEERKEFMKKVAAAI